VLERCSLAETGAALSPLVMLIIGFETRAGWVRCSDGARSITSVEPDETGQATETVSAKVSGSAISALNVWRLPVT
jgi:hypothetical protein